MHTVLSPAARERLVKFLGMLGSDADGERASAGRLADRLVRDAGLTWADVISVSQPPPARPAPFGDHRHLARWAGRQPGLTTWETHFLAGMAARPWPPTPRQAATLRKIVDELRDGSRNGRAA